MDGRNKSRLSREAAGTLTAAGSNGRSHLTKKRRQPLMAVIPYSLIADQRLKPATFRVFAALLAHRERRERHPNHAWAFPSQATLARDLGLHESTVRHHLAKLSKLELIEIHPRTKLHPDFLGHPRARAYKFTDKPDDKATGWSITDESPPADHMSETAHPTGRPVMVEPGPISRLIRDPSAAEQTQLTDLRNRLPLLNALARAEKKRGLGRS